MKILVIAGNEIDIQVGYLEAQLQEEVRLNSVSQDGVSIYSCGTPLPQDDDWDWVATIGKCLAESTVPVNMDLSAEEDPIGSLLSAIMAVKEGSETEIVINETG